MRIEGAIPYSVVASCQPLELSDVLGEVGADPSAYFRVLSFGFGFKTIHGVLGRLFPIQSWAQVNCLTRAMS